MSLSPTSVYTSLIPKQSVDYQVVAETTSGNWLNAVNTDEIKLTMRHEQLFQFIYPEMPRRSDNGQVFLCLH